MPIDSSIGLLQTVGGIVDRESRRDCPTLQSMMALCAVAVLLALAFGCDAEVRKSDAELGLNPQQAAGRRVYDRNCDQCHEPYSTHGKKGPSLKGVFKKQYLPESGLPANDERVGEIVRFGRSKMPAYGQVLDQQQIQDLLAYMHTL